MSTCTATSQLSHAHQLPSILAERHQQLGFVVQKAESFGKENASVAFLFTTLDVSDDSVPKLKLELYASTKTKDGYVRGSEMTESKDWEARAGWRVAGA